MNNVFELRNAGLSFKEIARQLGLGSPQSASSRYYQTCKQLGQKPIKLYVGKPITPLNKEIVELHSSGWAYRQIGERFNLSAQNISNRYRHTCKRLGVESLHIYQKKIDEDRKQKMISLHKEGKNYREIGEMFSHDDKPLSRQRVHQIIGGEK